MTKKRFFLILALAMPILLLVGVKWLVPAILKLAPPPGAPLATAQSTEVLPSFLSLQASAELSLLSRLLNEEVPTQHTGMEEKNLHKRIKNGSYRWDVQRGAIQLTRHEDQLAFQLPFQGIITLQGNLDAGFLKLPLQTDGGLAGQVFGTANPIIRSDWSLAPNLSPAVSIQQAQIGLRGLGNIDLSGLLSEHLTQRLASQTGDLNALIGDRVKLAPLIEPLWQKGFTEVPLGDDVPLFASFAPRSIALAPITFDKEDALQLSLQAEVETNLHSSSRKSELASLATAPLPPLSTIDTERQTELHLRAAWGLDELNTFLREQTVEAELSDGKPLFLSYLQVQPFEGDRILITGQAQTDHGLFGRPHRSDFSAVVKPYFDPEKQVLAFGNMDIRLRADDGLSNASAWLLDNLVEALVQRGLRIDLVKESARAQEELAQALASSDIPEGVEPKVENLSLQLLDLYLAPEAAGKAQELVVYVKASADIHVHLTDAFQIPN